jgi:hypothetical protein
MKRLTLPFDKKKIMIQILYPMLGIPETGINPEYRDGKIGPGLQNVEINFKSKLVCRDSNLGPIILNPRIRD